MAIERKFERVKEPNDPLRCQATAGAAGQCPYKAVPDNPYCHMHGGGTATNNRKAKEAANNYRLQVYGERVKEFATNPQVKSLREEIGIARLLMEETLNRCADSTDLLLYSNKISGFVSQIERTVVACQRIEEKSGVLLDKTQVLQIADQILNIIANHIVDVSVLENIGNDIMSIFDDARAKNANDGEDSFGS